MKFEKETTYKFLKKLNKELTLKFSSMKSDFIHNPP